MAISGYKRLDFWSVFRVNVFGKMRFLVIRMFSALQISMTTTVSVSGSNVQIVYVGGYRQGNGPISDGFVGCVKVSEKGIHDQQSAELLNLREVFWVQRNGDCASIGVRKIMVGISFI